ncbi:hypothetical protein JCM10212_001362 [Sporobolomyces blumeae]
MSLQDPADPTRLEGTTAPAFKKKKRPTVQGSKLSISRELPGHSGGGDGERQDGAEGGDSLVAEDDDRSTSETLEQLLAIRKLKRTTAGLDLERLNAGERKKRPKASAGEGGERGEIVTKDGMIEGLNGGLRGGGGSGAKDRLRDDGNAPEAKARKIVKSDNFTGQTNTVDVDKHMMAYIEAELAKKRGGAEASSSESNPNKPYDPRDELYKVAEKYKFADVAEKEKNKQEKDEEEGNVTLSTSMLMGIPEVDLGIDIKLKNIEATEKAKRTLYEQQLAAARKADVEREEFAVERFYRHHRPAESDADALAKARAGEGAAEAEEEMRRARMVGNARRETATDDIAVQRFQKRQRQQWGKK